MPNPIKSIRQKKHLTQEVCAIRAAMRQSAWCKIEQKKSLEKTELASLRRIADALDILVIDLLVE